MPRVCFWWLLLVLLLPAAAFGAGLAPGGRVVVGGRMITDLGWWQRQAPLTRGGREAVGGVFLDLPRHSFLRLRWRRAAAGVGGVVELGLGSSQPATRVSLRHAYGWWQGGGWRLVVGHTASWFGGLAFRPRQSLGWQEADHLYLWGWGFLWPGRTTQVQVTRLGEGWGLQLALAEPRYQTAPQDADPYFYLPRISFSARLAWGGLELLPGASWVRHAYQGGAAGLDDHFDTWAVVLPLRWSRGALALKAQLHYGVNFYGEYVGWPVWAGVFFRPDGTAVDTEVWGGFLSVEYALGAVTLCVGYGREEMGNDAWQGSLGYARGRAVRQGWFLALPWRVGPWLALQPELAWYDHGDNPASGVAAGQEWLAGVQVRFRF